MKINVNEQGHLTIGGCDALELAQNYETPLVVYDVAQIRQQLRSYQEAFKQQQISAVVSYASKAFCAKAIYQVVQQEGAHVDVVSAGELATALAAGFDPQNISYHGNNKSLAELDFAIAQQVGVLVVDNFYELTLLQSLLHYKYPRQTIQVMLRITPGISAHTHEYDQTGQIDSKFGFDVNSGQAEKALQQVLQNPQLDLIGIHAHIGSQIMAVAGFELLVAKLCQLAHAWQQKYHFETKILNLGGGFGIRYTDSDEPLTAQQFVEAIVQTLRKEWVNSDSELPQVWIEPGRAIVGNAGVSLYTIGSKKTIPHVRTFLTVDGGMGDNIRPALYQAQYEAVLARAPLAAAEQTVTVAGRYCESGDVLISQQALPATQPGDILAVLATGAYGYSMASNYNRIGRPAVVFAEEGQGQIVVAREEIVDLMHLDQDYVKENE
ncbi:diaminopimelate decarboxylase [Bombilactobacillus folatiphilus]|uniref:Diaminopimelate decarboxylase n=1 Tax=Bombilactobacillus folatiphilus TaxID=2923362 RepID=A0ABY4PB19_9LACO|nr:diaminopimelate decarboxylase [Bombilactobacillus folatiphilus]UQS82868.1 diaminopimelate decarboxylase [Bombilactobacillus folatiphilus]